MRVLKHSRLLEKPYVYRRKGNEEQAKFINKVKDVLAEVHSELSQVAPSSSPALAHAKEAIESGLKLLTERQKLIKIADRSEHGWGVVSEYTADDLADDTKRLEKAERAAERKAKKRRIAVQKPCQRQPSLSATGGTATHSNAGLITPLPVKQSAPTPPMRTRPVGPCFACGDLGHLRNSCPRTPTTGAGGKKLYPSPLGVIRCSKEEHGISCDDVVMPVEIPDVSLVAACKEEGVPNT